MNGIPLRIWRDAAWETVYLSTRRSGETGCAIAQARAEFRAQSRLAAREAKLAAIVGAAARDDDPLERLMELSARQDQHMADHERLDQAAMDAAREAARLALADCHGADEAARILDCLSDGHLRRIMRVLDVGEAPDDFFGHRGTPPSASGTGRAAATTAASSPPSAAPSTTPTAPKLAKEIAAA